MKKSSTCLTPFATFDHIFRLLAPAHYRHADLDRGCAPHDRPSSRRVFWLVLSLFMLAGTPAFAANWVTAPPLSVAPNASFPIQFTLNFPSGTPPTWVVMWLQSPSGAWQKVYQAGGSPGASITSPVINPSLSTLGTYNWRATGEANSSVTTPTGATQLSAQTVVQLTATTFAFSNLTFTYDGNTKTASVTPSPSGATYTSDLTKGPGAGTYTVSATATGNYTGSGSATLTINKANQSAVSITSGSSFTYSGSYTAAASGGNGTGALVWALGAGSSAAGAGINSSTGAITANSVGSVVIKAYRAGDQNYNQSATTADFPVTVSPIATTFSVSPTSFTYTGGAQGPTIVPTPGGATFSTGGTLSATVANNSYTATATATGNYSGSNSTTWSIARANQTITFNNPGTQTYGTPLALNASASSGLPVSFVVTSGPATISGNTATFTGTGSVTITASQAGDTNYNAATNVGQTFSVAPAATTFALNQISFLYNGSAQGPTVVATPNGASFTPGGTLSAVNVGAYTATATASGNYSGSNSGLNWSIAASGQTITFNNPGTQTYGTTLSLGATASSGLPVSFTVASGPATVTGNTATFTGVGTVTITASQAGNSNYAAAAPVSPSFSVLKADPAKSLAGRTLYTGTGSSVYFIVSSDLNASFTNAGNGTVAQPTGTIAYTIATGSPSGTPGTAITTSSQLALGTYYIQATYPGDANYNAASITATWVVKVPASLAAQLGLGSQSNVEQNDANNTQTGLKVNRPQ